MKNVFSSIAFYLFPTLAIAQMASFTKSAIIEVLLQQQVADKIFFDYGVEGSVEAGRYAFICPDTTFQKSYKGIFDDFPYANHPNGMIWKVRFYSDSVRSIYINGSEDPSLIIVFRKIMITPESATIVFFTTTTRDQERFENNYTSVSSNLRRIGDEWKIDKLRVKKTGWIEYFKRDERMRIGRKP